MSDQIGPLTPEELFNDPRCRFTFDDGERCVQFHEHVDYDWSREHVPPGDPLPLHPDLVVGVDIASR